MCASPRLLETERKLLRSGIVRQFVRLSSPVVLDGPGSHTRRVCGATAEVGTGRQCNRAVVTRGTGARFLASRSDA